MKTKLILLAIFLIKSNFLFPQEVNSDIDKTVIVNAEKSINQDAINYFNIFLKNKNWAGYTDGELAYDKYSNTLNYNETSILKFPTTGEVHQEGTVNFSIPIDKISKIVETIYIKDPDDLYDVNLLTFEIYFKEDVKYYYLITERDRLPEQNTDFREHVSLDPKKDLSNDDIPNLRQAIRDIFEGVEFEQVWFKPH